MDFDLPAMFRLNCAVSLSYDVAILLKTSGSLLIFLALGIGISISAGIIRKAHSNVGDMLTRWCTSSILSLSFLIYPGISLSLFRWFKCVPAGPDTKLLLADMSGM